MKDLIHAKFKLNYYLRATCITMFRRTFEISLKEATDLVDSFFDGTHALSKDVILTPYQYGKLHAYYLMAEGSPIYIYEIKLVEVNRNTIDFAAKFGGTQ